MQAHYNNRLASPKTVWPVWPGSDSSRKVPKRRCLCELLRSLESPEARNEWGNLWKRSFATARPCRSSRSRYLAATILAGSSWSCHWVQFITSDKLTVRRQLLCTNIQLFVHRHWRPKGLIIQQTQAEEEKKFQAQGGYHCLLRRLVLITFLYLSLTSFIKPSHKSCKVRLFSGYLHSSQMIDQGGLQYKPTWVMAFLLFSLHSLLSFYAVIVFSQNHNQAGCRSQVPDLFTNTPDQPPPPSPVICFMLLWILPPGVWGGLAQDRN